MSEKISTLNTKEVQSIFEISEKINELTDKMIKLYSISLIYNMGLGYMYEQDLSLSQEVCTSISDIFTTVSRNIKEDLLSVRDNLSEFYTEKRNEVYCNE